MKKKIKKSTVFGLLTLLFVLLTVAGFVYAYLSPEPVSKFWVLAPCFIALVFSNLMVRARK